MPLPYLRHGERRDDFELLTAVTFLNSLLNSSQPSEVVVCSSSARNSRSAGETRSRAADQHAQRSPQLAITEFHGREQTRLHFVANRFFRNEGDSVLDLDRTFDCLNVIKLQHELHLHAFGSQLGARAVSFAELGKTPSCPEGWVVSRCLAS